MRSEVKKDSEEVQKSVDDDRSLVIQVLIVYRVGQNYTDFLKKFLSETTTNITKTTLKTNEIIQSDHH